MSGDPMWPPRSVRLGDTDIAAIVGAEDANGNGIAGFVAIFNKTAIRLDIIKVQ